MKTNIRYINKLAIWLTGLLAISVQGPLGYLVAILSLTLWVWEGELLKVECRACMWLRRRMGV